MCFPGEESREYWRLGHGGTGERLESRPSDREGCIFAMESLVLDSIPLWAVQPEEGSLDGEQVASLRWAARDANSAEGQPWTCWEAVKQPQRTLLGSAGLATDPPLTEWLRCHPRSFEPSARCLPLPVNGVALWKELGRCVLAFTVDGQLVHFSCLHAATLDDGAAVEIRDLLQCLAAWEIPLAVAEARLWTQAEHGFVETFHRISGASIQEEPRPAPVLPARTRPLLPPQVAQAWQRQARQRRQAFALGSLAAAYFLAFAAWGATLVWKSHSLDEREHRIALLRPQMQTTQAAQEQWLAVEPAVDPDTYVPEIFHRVVSLLPPEGIRLKEFGLDREKLTVAGEASTVAHAKQFQSDVTGSPGLRQFAWNFPQPTILEDNRASFRAEGLTGKGGRSHETR